ncbi:hypothetical protein N431DRAFT_369075 [Stipitochalara longipes BDJ]|nr:hypothetical protein N431DRAFT_369075 [Stipitochalara longipes BDJ]
MEAQSLSTCNQCGKKFQRKAHLLRHQQQHSGDRPYSCKFCSKTFKRSDVLRDHFSRCERRGNSAIPSSLERGRKRHACDECSRLKVKCDNNVPCRKCTEFGRKCVKSRTTAASSPEETATPGPSTPDTGSDRNSIGFLLNGTGETDFMREFPKSTTLSPHNKAADFASMAVENRFDPAAAGPSMYQAYGQAPQENNLDVMLSQLEFGNFEQRTNNWQMPGENMILWSGPDSLFVDRTAMDQRAFDIREKLKYTAATHNPPHPPSKELLDAIELITADNFAAYIKLYFRHWHKHAPMVHEATFNPTTAALPLVLALMSLGGMYSKEGGDVLKLTMLLDTIEAYMFSIPGLNDEYDLPGRTYVKQGEDASPEWQQYQLESLQGIYLMIVLQYWTGNHTARMRVRQQRFCRVVAIFHHLELQTVQHSPTFSIKDQSSFRTWIRKESYIRLMTMALMLDNSFGIFHNVTPRFQWAELDVPFQADDRFFRLANYDAMIASKIAPVPRMKIKDAFLLLFSPPETQEQDLDILRQGQLNALDMQMLIHFLYTHLWAATFSNPLASLPSTSIPDLLLPFKAAMFAWKLLWDEIKTISLEKGEWNKLGFQRTAEGYFEAVKEVAEGFEKRSAAGAGGGIKGDCEKGLHLRHILSF